MLMEHITLKRIFPLLFVSFLNGNDSMDELLMMDFDALLDMPVVSATKTLTPLSKIPATVRVITAKQIKKRGYITLEEALSNLPGFQFRNINGFNTYTFMRGAPSQNNLILLMIDGIKINEINSGGFYGGLQYNLENVKQIEVLYGPSSVLYGTNAISGIINIITYNPKDYKNESSTISFSAGKFDTVISDFRTGYFNENNEFGFTMSGRYATSEKADLGGSDGDFNWNENMQNYEDSYDIEAKLEYKNFQAGLVYQDKESSMTTYRKTIGDIYQDTGTSWHITFLNLWARHNHSFSNTLSLNSLLYYRDATVEDDTIESIRTLPSPGTQIGFYRPNSLFGIEEQLNYEFLPGHNITLGTVFEKEKTSEGFSKTNSTASNITPTAPSTPVKLEESVFSFYLQTRHDILESINVTLGIRYDDSSIYEKVLTPRVAFLYNNDDFRFRALYSEAFRAPRPWDYTSGTGNSSLDEEEMTSYELGFDYRVNEKLNTTLAIYDNEISNKLVKDLIQNKWINLGELITKGSELTIEYRENEYNLYFNYTYTMSEDEQGNDVPEISKHTANVEAEYTFNEHVELTVSANYFGERKNTKIIATTNSNLIEDATVFNMQLSYYDFYKWDIHLQARNITDETYYHTSNLMPDRYTQPQQSFILKAQYRF